MELEDLLKFVAPFIWFAVATVARMARKGRRVPEPTEAESDAGEPLQVETQADDPYEDPYEEMLDVAPDEAVAEAVPDLDERSSEELSVQLYERELEQLERAARTAFERAERIRSSETPHLDAEDVRSSDVVRDAIVLHAILHRPRSGRLQPRRSR